jgi:hypothetical protein
MNKYRNEIAIGTLLALFFTGTVFWFSRHESDAYLKIGIAALIIVLGTGSFVWKTIQRKRDIEAGASADDEFTEKVKLHAGSQAFLYSLWLWFFIFIFNTSFSENEEMLGFGILGSALIYGLLLWYFRKTSDF